MRSHLKVKVFTLGAEMTYIRRQEQKWKEKARAARQREKIDSDPEHRNHNASAVAYCENNFWSQRVHRQHLKSDARWSHLAYGFMKGVSYSQMEFICYGDLKGFGTVEPDWGRIEEIVAKFSQDEPKLPDLMQKFSEWKADALLWYEGNAERRETAKRVSEDKKAFYAADEAYQNARREYRELAKQAGIKAAEEGWIKRRGKWRNPAYEATLARG